METGRVRNAARTTLRQRHVFPMQVPEGKLREGCERRRPINICNLSHQDGPVQHLWLAKNVYGRDVNDACFDLFASYVRKVDNKSKLQLLTGAQKAVERRVRLSKRQDADRG